MSEQQIALPAHLQNQGDEAAKQALADAQSMSSASNSVPRISLRGREFRFVVNGEEIKKVRDKITVNILGVEPEGRNMIKTWYSKGYVSGAKEPPDCSSENGISPNPWVQNKQSQFCASCPKNQFGSATSPSGKATKACRDAKRIWVTDAADTKPIEDRTQYGLTVTVASLKSFAEHGRALAGYGQSPSVAITELEMLDKEYPELKFNLVGWADAVTAPKALELNAKKPWKIYAGSALALADESGGPKAQLPMSVPEHLRPKTQAATQVVDAAPREAPSAAKINDAVSDW